MGPGVESQKTARVAGQRHRPGLPTAVKIGNAPFRRSASIEPQRLDGMEPGGFDGGRDPGDDADPDTEAEGHDQ
jgi:hypothetical protein